MTVLKDIFAGLSGGLFKDVRGLVDDLVTSKEEKLTIAAKLREVELEFAQKTDQLDLDYQKQLTERHKTDMVSDSWLSKNLRPLVLLFLVLGFTTLSLLDGFPIDFTFDKMIISVFESWGSLALMFYFGSRGIEKVIKIRDKK